MSDYVTMEMSNEVMVVRFDRQGALNALNHKMITELTEAAKLLAEDLTVKSVVLTGASTAFSSGVDLKDTQNWDIETMSDLEIRRLFYRGVRLCQAWEDLPQITIAAAEGMMVGGGCALGLACDWRVLARDAYVFVPEVQVGLNLQWGALPRLVTLVGPARAKEICLLGEKMPSEQALDWGLVSRLAEPSESVNVALGLAKRCAANPPIASAMVKEAVNAIAGSLHRIGSYADADQSQLSATNQNAVGARMRFAGSTPETP
jgi:enoyl-CoA hydratase